MNVPQHVLITIIFVVIIWPFTGAWALLAFIGGVLIDFDHLLYYIIKEKDFNLKNSYNYFRRIGHEGDDEKYKELRLMFHSFDAFLIMFILALFVRELIPLFLGMTLHLCLDVVYTYYKTGKFLTFTLFKKSGIVSLIRLIRNI